MRTTARFAFALAVSGLCACEEKAVSIELTPNAFAIETAGGRKAIAATVKGKDGSVLEKTIVWSSNNEKVALVDNTGVVTGTGSGRALISAQSDESIAAARVDVAILGNLKLDNPALVLHLGEPIPLPKVIALNERGEPFDMPSLKPTWSVANSGIVQVIGGTTLTPITLGSTMLRATFGSITVDAVVNVTTGENTMGSAATTGDAAFETP